MTDEQMRLKRERLAQSMDQLWEIYTDCDRLMGTTEGVCDTGGHPDFNAVALSLLPDAVDPGADRLEHCSLNQLVGMISKCQRCPLGALRKNSVPGEGVLNPRVMVVGEGPGAEEDGSGRPFVGKAGRYLDTWLAAISISRDRNAYIANIVKCRPPGNRDPLPEETSACLPYLKRQIVLVKPEVILCVGRVAAHVLLGREDGVGKLRGNFHRFEGTPLLVTYHPSAVLRNPEYRGPVWKDMQQLAAFLHIALPQKRE